MIELTILSLFKEFSKTNTSAQKRLCGSIKIRSELCECSNLTILSQLELHLTSDLNYFISNEIRYVF